MSPGFHSGGLVAIIALTGLASLPLQARAQPNAGSLLNQQERQHRQRPAQLPTPKAPSAQPHRRATGGVSVLVKSVRFSGDTTLVSKTRLQAVVSPAIGKQLDFAGLQRLTRQVTDFLRRQGWLLAEAYLPQQDVTGGHIDIDIRGGRLDGLGGKGTPFSIVGAGKSKLRIKRARLDAIAGGLLQPGANVRRGSLERSLLLMNDLPGVSARARLQKGISADSTHVRIAVKEGPSLTGSAWADNYGDYATGSFQRNLAGRINDPYGNGDQIGGSITDSRGLDLLRLGYSLPVGSRGLRMTALASAMHYRVVEGIGVNSGLRGNSGTAGATFNYPLIRSRMLNLYGAAGFTYRRLKDTSSAGTLDDKRLEVLHAGLSGSLFDDLAGGGLTSWGITATFGRLDLTNSANALADAAGYDTQGNYDKLDYNLARLQRLPGQFSLLAKVSGQIAGANLDSSEQFFLGGPFGVRGYPVGEAIGDEGWITSVELRYNAPWLTALGNLQLQGFVDAGQIGLHHNPKQLPIATATGRNRYNLADWGLAATLQQPGRYSVRLLWADTLGSNPGRTVQGKDVDNHSYGSRVWAQATVWF